MHQKSSAATSAQSAETEKNDDQDELTMTKEPDSTLRNPFEDDAEDVDEDDDSDDGLGNESGNAGGNWNSQGRGGWWRGAMSRQEERFGDGRDDDSDSDKDDAADDDEEFGDFAMPEVDGEGNASPDKTNVIVKPLPVHPPSQNQKSSAFTSLWPFSSPGFGTSKEKDKEREKEKEKEKEKPAKSDESGTAPTGEQSAVTGDDGKKIKSTHEATSRTSIEDPDDEEVVV